MSKDEITEALTETAKIRPARKHAHRGRRYQPRYVEESVAEQEIAQAAAKFDPAEDVINSDREKLSKFTTDEKLLDIWERRLVSPDGISAPPIRIKTKGMRLRWINLTVRGRYTRARYEQGWQPVHQDELIDAREIHAIQFTSEGFVTRGERQSEMLMKIPEAIFRRIQQRRVELNIKSYKTLKENMASSGAEHFQNKYGPSAGSEAGDIISNFKGNVSFGTERVSSDDLLEE